MDPLDVEMTPSPRVKEAAVALMEAMKADGQKSLLVEINLDRIVVTTAGGKIILHQSRELAHV